jgi:hypothetical protein
MADVFNNTTNAVFIPTIIANKALGRFASYMNLARTVSRDSDWTTSTEGATIQVPKRGTLSANSKAAGSSVTKQNPTATNISVTLDQHFEVTFLLDDVTKVLQNQNTQDGYAEDAAIALAEKVETYLAGLHPSITNTITWNNASTATKTAQLLALRKRFVDNKVPKNDVKYLYADASLINDLLTEANFTQVQTIGSSQGLLEGAILKLFGFQIFESQNIAYTGSPGAYHNLAYTRNAMVLASRPLPMDGNGAGVVQQTIISNDVGMGLRATMGYDKDLQAMQLTLDILFGASILDTRCVVELESF